MTITSNVTVLGRPLFCVCADQAVHDSCSTRRSLRLSVPPGTSVAFLLAPVQSSPWHQCSIRPASVQRPPLHQSSVRPCTGACSVVRYMSCTIRRILPSFSARECGTDDLYSHARQTVPSKSLWLNETFHLEVHEYILAT